MICIFWGIKIIVTCSACICKRVTKIVSKEKLQTHIDILHSEYYTLYVSYRRCTFIPKLIEME